MGSLQFNPKTMPLRKTLSPQGNGGAAGLCCYVRKYCVLTIIAGASMVGFMLYADQEMVRNLNETQPPLIRKPVEYLSNLAVEAGVVETGVESESGNSLSSVQGSEIEEVVAKNEIVSTPETAEQQGNEQPDVVQAAVDQTAADDKPVEEESTSFENKITTPESTEETEVNKSPIEETQVEKQSTPDVDALNESPADHQTEITQQESANNDVATNVAPIDPTETNQQSEENVAGKDNPIEETNGEIAAGGKQSEETTANDGSPSKPRLYLHVGPQKTGSSTLQSALDIISQLSYKLEDDHLTYSHITPEVGSFDCELGPWGGFLNCVVSEKLNNLMAETREAGQNLLLTDENLGDRFVAPLRNAIDSNLWDVTVIVMYRRIHEWLVSWWNQINKTTNLDAEGKILIDENGNPYREEHKHWPSEGGVYVPEFTAWYKEYIQYWDASDLVSHHRSIEYFNQYKDTFDNVKVYNMHTEGDIVTNFFCDVINTPNTCQKLQNKEVDLSEVNASVNLYHDILATYFYDQGLINEALSRQQVVSLIGDFVKRSHKEIPRICDQSVLTQIFDWLVASEKIMLSESWTSSSEAELLTIFDAYVAKGKICDLDREAVLQDEEWRAFFQSLGKDSATQAVDEKSTAEDGTSVERDLTNNS